jgi:uncharacterized membrane protein YbaN (DUF454 family)
MTWTALGAFFVGLGAVGMVLPLLPTTPFLLLAAGCFARGSPRAYRWLMENRYMGAQLKNYREGKGLSRKAKLVSLAFLYLVLGSSALLTHASPLITAILVVVGTAVTIHLVLLRTAPGASKQ